MTRLIITNKKGSKRLEIIGKSKGNIHICHYGDTDFGMGHYGGYTKDLTNNVLEITNKKGV